MRWPWHVDLEVEQVLIGTARRGRVRVTASLHNDFNSDIKHFLFLLRRDEAGRFFVTDLKTLIVRDVRGRFAMPLARPLDPEELFPETWIPPSYEEALRPVRYRTTDAWWLQPPLVHAEDRSEADPGWARPSGRGLVALRALYLSDWARMVRAQPGAICPSR